MAASSHGARSRVSTSPGSRYPSDEAHEDFFVGLIWFWAYNAFRKALVRRMLSNRGGCELQLFFLTCARFGRQSQRHPQRRLRRAVIYRRERLYNFSCIIKTAGRVSYTWPSRIQRK